MKFSLTEIAEAIRDLGYKGKELLEEKFSLIESSTNGRSFYVYPLISENKSLLSNDSQALLVRFKAAWYDMDGFEESQIDALCNWFNANQPFAKLFRRSSDDSLDIILEADLYVLDGMSKASFQNRTQAFINSYEYAMKCIAKCTYVDKQEIIDRHNKAIDILHSDTGDTDEAVNLYRINSHLGFAGSQNNFGDLFETGDYIIKDELLAMYWYTRSSERGEPTAYYSLASMLEKFRKNPDSMVLAAKYAILACENLPEGKNMAAALEIKKTLQEVLSADLYKLAESYASDFKPIIEEKWTLSDAPGPKVTVVPGSELLN